MAEAFPGETRRRSVGETRRRSVGEHDDDDDDDDDDTHHNDDIDDEERAKEIEGLKKQGILPNDFPVKDGDLKYDNDDMTQELEELLALGIITKEDAARLTNKEELTNEVSLDTLIDPHIADHEQMLPPFASDGIPLNWSRNVKEDKLYNLVKLKKGDPEFDIISNEFEKVNIKVKGIERLQSNRQLKRFQDELDDVKRHRDPETYNPNIRYLYHGTSVDKSRICEEGLDQRLSRMGYFGKGIYFSDNPLKCVHYSDDPAKKNPEEAYILKCRVILGDAKVFAKGCYDTTLKREPEKDVSTHGWRYFDSVVGCPKDFNEFVVYENRRAMIEYIISFQVDRKMLTDLRQKSLVKDSPKKSENADHSKTQPTEPGLQDDHFARISEVREAVRKKRLEEAGKQYIPPSEGQQQHDREMWSRLQMLHHLDGSDKTSQVPEKHNKVHSKGDNLEHSISTKPPQHSTKQTKPQQKEEVKEQVNEVQQVLDFCIVEFLKVTDTDDSKLARYYVQKSKMDVNKAILMYYEDIG